ncbi:heterokaryon incompatibility protein-domain-containing protein [Apiospora rasikravindrae]|uniref:Heterokaryon incompatibility protein-domain-containing protein n=1 Tax=Apiospora rasikravindrae TaxID=990691 RepID=A0ABR1S0S3_9PEZI
MNLTAESRSVPFNLCNWVLCGGATSMSLDLPARALDRVPTVISYTYQPLGPSQVRLLTLYPGDEPDEIRIRLRHVKLPPTDSDIDANSETGDLSLPEYEALSYTWGTSYSRRQRVLVETDEDGGSNGNLQFMLSITDNLAEAMRRIRHTAAANKTLWIDALCINQADTGEKSIQVPLMTVIYKSAVRVLVWLGPECDNSALAMRLIEFTGARVEVDWASYAYTGVDDDYEADVEAEFDTAFSDLANVDPVYSLLEREWFKRVWVRQEVFLARQAVVFCGTSAMGWADFRKGALVLASEFFGIQKATSLMYLVGTFPIDWFEVRDVLKGLQCANPRDRVYGLLALIDTNDAGLPEVDYSLSPAEVYTAVATHVFRNAEALHILMSCELTPDRMADLPSWVPDWSTSPENAHFYSGSYAATNTVPSVEFPQGPENHCRIPELPGDASLAKMRFVARHLLSLGLSPSGLRAPNSASSGNLIDWHLEDFIFSGQFIWEGRVIFLTEDGYIGLGPLSTSPGDTLFFPWGSSFPVLVRPAPVPPDGELDEEGDGPRQYLLVGPCYVTGLMSGEILYGPLPSNYCVVGRQANERGHWHSEIHKMVVRGNDVVSTERDTEYEKERVRRTFGVDDAKSVTPEMAIGKGIPITWVDFV